MTPSMRLNGLSVTAFISLSVLFSRSHNVDVSTHSLCVAADQVNDALDAFESLSTDEQDEVLAEMNSLDSEDSEDSNEDEIVDSEDAADDDEDSFDAEDEDADASVNALAVGGRSRRHDHASSSSSRGNAQREPLTPAQHERANGHWSTIRSFREWADHHGKEYSPSKRATAAAAFAHNMQLIEAHNAKNSTFKLGPTRHADMTNEEYRKSVLTTGLSHHGRTESELDELRTRLNFKTSNPLREFGWEGDWVSPSTLRHRHLGSESRVRGKALAEHVDWRTQGVVRPPKDQGMCGSCWAFSANDALESSWAQFTAAKGKLELPNLSEQELVDCINKGANTCDRGGEMYEGFQYAVANGMTSDTDYTYKATSDKVCYASNYTKTDVAYSGFHTIRRGDEDDLQQAVALHAGISIGIDASHYTFQLYASGVYDEPTCGNHPWNMDHGVGLVGYGTDPKHDDKPYWIVKNSWGQAWGDHGYILMSRNAKNQCGVATQASFPIPTDKKSKTHAPHRARPARRHSPKHSTYSMYSSPVAARKH